MSIIDNVTVAILPNTCTFASHNQSVFIAYSILGRMSYLMCEISIVNVHLFETFCLLSISPLYAVYLVLNVNIFSNMQLRTFILTQRSPVVSFQHSAGAWDRKAASDRWLGKTILWYLRYEVSMKGNTKINNSVSMQMHCSIASFIIYKRLYVYAYIDVCVYTCVYIY